MLGMPDIETIDIITINCNTTDKQTSSGRISKRQTHSWNYTNKGWEAEVQSKCIVLTVRVLRVIIQIQWY